MRASDLPLLRLSRQRVAGSHPASPEALVRGMVALQAQDFPMARWAVGVRVTRCTDAAVLAAINRGSLIRMHLLRPTWHLAAADDVRWLLRLSAPQIRQRASYRDRQLELTGALFAKSNRLLERALRDGTQLTREEIVTRLRAARVPVDDNRASHLLLRAELDGVICSGACRGSKPTYALLDERVEPARPVSRDEALAGLASRYYQSRGPATVEDFTWWSGLAAGDARRAVESVAGSLAAAQIESRTYYSSPDGAAPARAKAAVLLLPAYDEFMISYADRTAMLAGVSERKTVSDNGIFYPIVVEKGQVIGRWTRRSEKGRFRVEVALFGRPRRGVRDGIAAFLARLERFWNVKASLEWAAS